MMGSGSHLFCNYSLHHLTLDCEALLTGFASLVKFATDRTTHTYHINGWQRVLRPHRRFIVIAGISATVADAFQEATLQNDQVARRLPELQELVDERLTCLLQHDDAVWVELAGCVRAEEKPRELRGDVIFAALLSLGFLRERVFRHAEKRPWSLCRGAVWKRERMGKRDEREQENIGE